MLNVSNSGYKTQKEGLWNEPMLLQQVAAGDWEAYTELFHYYLPKLAIHISFYGAIAGRYRRSNPGSIS